MNSTTTSNSTNQQCFIFKNIDNTANSCSNTTNNLLLNHRLNQQPQQQQIEYIERNIITSNDLLNTSDASPSSSSASASASSSPSSQLSSSPIFAAVNPSNSNTNVVNDTSSFLKKPLRIFKSFLPSFASTNNSGLVELSFPIW